MKLHQHSALSIIDMLRKEEVTPSHLITVLQERADLVEPRINALVTPCWERAHEAAAQLEQLAPTERGPLCGLPVAIKDLMPISGVRTTFGSLPFKDNIPTQSDSLVLHLEAQGAVISGQTNTPEFGAGGNTFNDVFGATRNPWHLNKSAGGSSGGAAASLAAGTSWLAMGSDYAGSLRTPAAFCGVVGLRPTAYRIPWGPKKNAFDDMAVQGPMARDVRDAAFFLDQLVHKDKGTPFTSPLPEQSFLQYANQPNTQAKIAYSPDLGLGTVSPVISRQVERAMNTLAQVNFSVQPVDLDLRYMDDSYHAFRALEFATMHKELLRNHRDKIKPELIWNIEKGMLLSGSELSTAISNRSRGFFELMQVLEQVDVLICPASIVPAFDVEQRYYGQAQGLGYDQYLDWLAITYVLTPLGVPVLSLPCGMTEDGLPVGIQLVGKPNGEAQLLSVATAIEASLGQWATHEQELETRLLAAAS